jgi:hypothetical protein
MTNIAGGLVMNLSKRITRMLTNLPWIDRNHAGIGFFSELREEYPCKKKLSY